jgi:hypothetical protein
MSSDLGGDKSTIFICGKVRAVRLLYGVVWPIALD